MYSNINTLNAILSSWYIEYLLVNPNFPLKLYYSYQLLDFVFAKY